MNRCANTVFLESSKKETKQFNLDTNETNLELKNLIKRISQSKKCVVVTGAGISVSSGIADFRSKEGIFARVCKKYPGKFGSGKELFDANYVFTNQERLKIFYEFMNELHEECLKASPTRTHRMIQKMEARNILSRCYTQNIDCLETKAGLSVNSFLDVSRNNWADNSITNLAEASVYNQFEDLIAENKTQYFERKSDYIRNKVVQLHGTLGACICTLCLTPFEKNGLHNYTQLNDFLRPGNIPNSNERTPVTKGIQFGMACPKCRARSELRAGQGRRSTPIGTLRPAVVLYNEQHMYSHKIADFISVDTRLSTRARIPDLILVMGTAMTSPGCVHLIRQLANATHQAKDRGIVVVVNFNSVCHRINSFVRSADTSSNAFPTVDYEILGDVDKFSNLVMDEWKTQTSIKQWAKATKNHTSVDIPSKIKELKRKGPNAVALTSEKITALIKVAASGKTAKVQKRPTYSLPKQSPSYPIKHSKQSQTKNQAMPITISQRRSLRLQKKQELLQFVPVV